MRLRGRPFHLVVLTVSLALWARGAPGAGEPRLVNGGFDEWDPKTLLPVGWIYWAESKRYPNISREGDAVRCYLPVYDFVTLQQYVAAAPKTPYRITFRCRGTFRGTVAINVEPVGGQVVPVDHEWNFDSPWRQQAFEFTSGERESLGIQFRLIGKGVIWIDDVRIEPAAAAKAP